MELELNYMEVGQRIRAQRIRQNISQEQLSELAELSVTHTSHIETGNTKLSLPALLKIANALGVSADALLCDSLKQAKAIFENELGAVVLDCSEEEIRIVTDTVKALKQSLRSRQTPR